MLQINELLTTRNNFNICEQAPVHAQTLSKRSEIHQLYEVVIDILEKHFHWN